MENVLVLGGSGLIGKAIINELNNKSEFEIYATYFQSLPPLGLERSIKVDVDNLEDISNMLKKVKPQSVISCLRGNFNSQLNFHKKVAEYLKENNGKLYFFSTTNVFDNDLSKPHYEDESPNSCTDYGRYKLACEESMRDILNDNACILRIPQVWGKNSPRMKELLHATNNNGKITVYPKLYINTNTDVFIAKQLCYIIEHKLSGIFHLAAEDVVGFKEFYNELIKRLGLSNVDILESNEEQGTFALLSKRSNEFPSELRTKNKSVIEYLTTKNTGSLK